MVTLSCPLALKVLGGPYQGAMINVAVTGFSRVIYFKQ